MATNIQDILKDPDFQGLNSVEKGKVLSRIDPDYAKLPSVEQQKVLAKISIAQPTRTSFLDRAGKPPLPERPAPSAAPTDNVPKWGTEQGVFGKYGPDVYGAVGAAKETLGPIVETGGLLGGGTIGGITGGPAGAVVGAGLGYGAAKRLTKTADVALGNAPVETLGQAVKSTIGDVKTGAIVEMGGQVIGTAATAVLGKLPPIARKLYESAIKPAPSLTTSAREKIITTGLENAVAGKPYRPNEKDVFQLGKNITDLVDKADNMVMENVEGRVIPVKPIREALDKVSESFSKGPFPQKDIATINALKKEFTKKRGAMMTAEDALNMKKYIYKFAEKYYKSGQTAIVPAKIEAEKAIARALRQELETAFPATAPINKEASKQIEFGKILERAANRVGNRELFSLFDFLGGAMGGSITGGVGGMAEGGIVTKILSGPQSKSIIAKQLMKAAIPNTVKSQILSQLTRYGIAKEMEYKKSNSESKALSEPEKALPEGD